MLNNTKFTNTIIGTCVITCENSNHNSDFEGPRIIDGVLTATDKPVKYYVRRFLENNGEIIFYSKNVLPDGKVCTIQDRVNELKIDNISKHFNCVDNKFFGFTILDVEKVKCEFNGSMQITYGKNIYKDNEVSVNTITSQFPSGAEKGQTTIGSEHKVNKAHYVHNIHFHPLKLERDILMNREEFKNNIPYYTTDEVEKMKNSFSKCIGSSVDGSYKSASKSNTYVGLVVFVTLKEGTNIDITINNCIECDEFSNFDLSKLYAKVDKYKDYIEQVDIAYTEDKSVINKPENNTELYNISDCGYISKK